MATKFEKAYNEAIAPYPVLADYYDDHKDEYEAQAREFFEQSSIFRSIADNFNFFGEYIEVVDMDDPRMAEMAEDGNNLNALFNWPMKSASDIAREAVEQYDDLYTARAIGGMVNCCTDLADKDEAVEDAEYCRDTEVLTYTLLGKQVVVNGEFEHVTRDGVECVHHTDVLPNGRKVDIYAKI